jgi:hypothetical protein
LAILNRGQWWQDWFGTTNQPNKIEGATIASENYSSFISLRGRRHGTAVDGRCIMVRLVSRWLKKSWVLIGDGAYASIHFGHQCNKMGVTLISRLRRDAVRYQKPEPVPAGRKGGKPVKGKQTPSFKELLEEVAQTGW